MDDKKVGYKKLIIWEKADKLAFKIYKVTKNFPKEELYGIISQIRRASLSVPLNIAEGYARQTKNELKQFINIALGSLAEVKYLIDFSSRLNYLAKDDYNELQNLAEENGRILWKFYKTL